MEAPHCKAACAPARAACDKRPYTSIRTESGLLFIEERVTGPLRRQADSIDKAPPTSSGDAIWTIEKSPPTKLRDSIVVNRGTITGHMTVIHVRQEPDCEIAQILCETRCAGSK